MAKDKKIITKQYLILVKDWKNDIKAFKKALKKDDENLKQLTKKTYVSTDKLYKFAKDNKDKLLSENPKNNLKTYNDMLADIKRFHDYLNKEHNVYDTVDKKVKL